MASPRSGAPASHTRPTGPHRRPPRCDARRHTPRRQLLLLVQRVLAPDTSQDKDNHRIRKIGIATPQLLPSPSPPPPSPSPRAAALALAAAALALMHRRRARNLQSVWTCGTEVNAVSGGCEIVCASTPSAGTNRRALEGSGTEQPSSAKSIIEAFLKQYPHATSTEMLKALSED